MLLSKLETMCNDELLPVLTDAYEETMTVPVSIIKMWFTDVHHRNHPGRHVIDSWTEKVTYRKGRTVSYIYGFDKQKGGLPVIFFEYGTPRIKPEFVLYYAFHDTEFLVVNRFEDALITALRKRGLID